MHANAGRVRAVVAALAAFGYRSIFRTLPDSSVRVLNSDHAGLHLPPVLNAKPLLAQALGFTRAKLRLAAELIDTHHLRQVGVLVHYVLPRQRLDRLGADIAESR